MSAGALATFFMSGDWVSCYTAIGMPCVFWTLTLCQIHGSQIPSHPLGWFSLFSSSLWTIWVDIISLDFLIACDLMSCVYVWNNRHLANVMFIFAMFSSTTFTAIGIYLKYLFYIFVIFTIVISPLRICMIYFDHAYLFIWYNSLISLFCLFDSQLFQHCLLKRLFCMHILMYSWQHHLRCWLYLHTFNSGFFILPHWSVCFSLCQCNCAFIKILVIYFLSVPRFKKDIYEIPAESIIINNEKR